MIRTGIRQWMTFGIWTLWVMLTDVYESYDVYEVCVFTFKALFSDGL